ncbi:alanine racemase, partial [bacterium]|nr:alanine racemase [bacterium]
MSDSGWLRLETDHEALRYNISRFREFTPAATRLLAVVKADGYGHGLLPAAVAFLDGGADMLGVHAVEEADALRRGGVEAPVLILGPVNREGASLASRLDAEITVGSLAGAAIAAEVAAPARPLRVHLKVETGVNRQGIVEDELDDALALLTGRPGLELVGVSSHFADIEDTTDHSWARAQSDRFTRWLATLADRGHGSLARHMSCSAAAILWRSAYRDIVRVGIAAYGIWPSRETLVSARAADHPDLVLKPAITWSCAVA